MDQRSPTPAALRRGQQPLPFDSLVSSGLSLSRLWQHGSRREKLLLLGGWGLCVLLCIASGLASVIYQWSGLAVTFGGVSVYLTVYPPLLICLWWTLCIGWLWGAIPAYLATLSLALYAGMPTSWALLFACANPLGLAVLGLGYRTIPVPLNLRTPSSLLYYVLLSFVASVFSSAGALIWCYTNQIDSTGILPIWQGWWLGGFLQSVLLVGPLLYFSWPPLRAWRQRRRQLQPKAPRDRQRLSLRLIAVIVIGVLGYGLITLSLANQTLFGTASGASPAAVDTFVATAWAFYWVSALIVSFIGFFGYRMVTYWHDDNARLLAELEQLARTDSLTGLLNRRAMEEVLEQQLQRVRRHTEQAALVLLDIDFFKRINDSHGHDVGDAVIRHIAQVLQELARSVDSVGRWGGEEFLVVLCGVTRDGAMSFAERVQERLASNPINVDGHPLICTISQGLAVPEPADEHYESWLKRADQALYQAKEEGRNRSVLA